MIEPHAVTLEPCYPPTLKRLRELVANQAGHVVHVLGYEGRRYEGAILCFERENGDLDAVTAQPLAHMCAGERVSGHADWHNKGVWVCT